MKVPKFMTSSLLGLAVSQAPLIWEGASRLLSMLKGRIALFQQPDGAKPVQEMTLRELAQEVGQLQRRARAIDDTQIEQIKLVQQVVEQNRMMAITLHGFAMRFRIVVALAVVLIALNGWLLIWILRH